MTKVIILNCEEQKIQKIKILPNPRTKIGKELNNLKLLQKSKTKIVTKLKNLNCDKTKKLVLGQN